MSAPTWTSTPANAATDAALRVACKKIAPLATLWKLLDIFDKRRINIENNAKTYDRFPSLQESSRAEAQSLAAVCREQRTAILQILDLLSVPVPQELHQ